MTTERYIPIVRWFHGELRNAGFSEEFLAKYRFQDRFDISGICFRF